MLSSSASASRAEQSDASDGDEPQHAVSPGPGKLLLTGPDSDERERSGCFFIKS